MSKVSAPSRGDWGVLHSGIGILELDDLFPYPPEETEGSYQDKSEVTRVSYDLIGGITKPSTSKEVTK